MTNSGTLRRLATLSLLAVVLLGGALALPVGSSKTALPLGIGSEAEAHGGVACPVTTRVRGSSTVHPIVEGAQASFQATRTGSALALASIGSGNGLNELLAGTNEVAPSSRPLNATELGSAYQYTIARDALVMAVRDSATMGFIGNITMTQVKGIYEGTITNWNQLGGPNQPIVPRARIVGSGTQPYFRGVFGIDATLEANTITATGLARLTTSLEMAQAAAANDFQISYTSLHEVATVPGVKALTLNGIAPSVATVQNATYPALRVLRLAVMKTGLAPRIDDSAHVIGDDFVNYMLTPAGQNIVTAQGFVSVLVPAQPPIPDWDVNLDGRTSLADLGAITSKWGQTSACHGWIRADTNNSGGVGLGDIGVVTGKWGSPGFVAPN